MLIYLLSFDIFTVQNIFTFGIKDKSIILTHAMYFLAIATNMPHRLKTAFVIQGHICSLLYSVIKIKKVFVVYILIVQS